MLHAITRLSLLTHYRVLLIMLSAALVWAGTALSAAVREHATVLYARAAVDIVQALILQGDTYRLQALAPAGAINWRLIYPAQRSTKERFELAATAVLFGETAATGSHEGPREYFELEDGARIMYAARLRGASEADMMLVMSLRIPSSSAIAAQTFRGASIASLICVGLIFLGVLAWVRWYLLALVLKVSRYARHVMKARSGAVVEPPDLHPDELASSNEVHRTSVAITAVARGLRLRQAEDQA